MVACAVLLLVMVLMGPLPALTQRETRQEKFHRQHIDFPRTSPELDAWRYCNLMMQRRGMTTSSCKLSNTFIHAQHASVDAICNNGGTLYNENYYDSNAPLEITACRVTGGSQRPPCKYRGRPNFQRVRVACEHGVPVHFKGFV
ncbi:hypothetical protein lerEdw1_015953 [Lerista edwardsae]|nr:hypothetical protein lerEdw1_015953 [Lerista edwardsae]